MGDIESWELYKRGRWDWTRHGYEKGFPNGSQFSDIDAAVEFDQRFLMIESKHHELGTPLPRFEGGQRYMYRKLVDRGVTVLVLFGDAPNNDPHAIRTLGKTYPQDRLTSFERFDIADRQWRLKQAIDGAMGLA